MKSKLAEKSMGVAIRIMHTGLIMYAQAYNSWAKDTLDDPEYKLANDQFCGQAWKDMATSLQQLMSGPNNLDRIDGLRASLSNEIHKMAEKSGFKPF